MKFRERERERESNKSLLRLSICHLLFIFSHILSWESRIFYLIFPSLIFPVFIISAILKRQTRTEITYGHAGEFFSWNSELFANPGIINGAIVFTGAILTQTGAGIITESAAAGGAPFASRLIAGLLFSLFLQISYLVHIYFLITLKELKLLSLLYPALEIWIKDQV